jgi:hypothetical protein
MQGTIGMRQAGPGARPSRRLLLGGLLGLGACQTVEQAVQTPTAQSIQGLRPSGTVRLDENFIASAGEGSGVLTFEGRSYPFKLVGSIMGPGGAVRINAEGEVYKLSRVADFAGRYNQSSGGIGLSQGGAGQLWLQNGNGVIMHLFSRTSGMMLSLGREEVVILLNN